MNQTILRDRVDPDLLERQTVKSVLHAMEGWASSAGPDSLRVIVTAAVHNAFQDNLVLTDLTYSTPPAPNWGGVLPGEVG